MTVPAPGAADLSFPFQAPPPPGATTEIAPGLHWARMPLPFRLNHVNLWLTQGTDGWSAIDAGCDTPDIRAAWDTLFAQTMGGAPLDRLIATHGHVDHVGLAGWLTDRFGARFIATFAEWIWARLVHIGGAPRMEETLARFLAIHGADAPLAERIVQDRRQFIDLSVDLPGTLHEIRDNEIIRFGDRDWRVIVTRGHAFEHAAFHCAPDGILIAGDHVLPAISPVIAVFETTPDADPLGDYLASFARFDAIPDDVLVLPSHGLPYRGLHRRIAQIRAHHVARLDSLADALGAPMSALALSRHLFPKVTDPVNVSFALGETLAHLHRLDRDGRARRLIGPDGGVRFGAPLTRRR